MISEEDFFYIYEYLEYFKILFVINNWYISNKWIKDGQRVFEGFSYISDNNIEWMLIEELWVWIVFNYYKIGSI